MFPSNYSLLRKISEYLKYSTHKIVTLVAQMVRHMPTMRVSGFDLWVEKSPWRRAWKPTPVFLPKEFHGQRKLVGYSTWGWKELYMTERLAHTHSSTMMYEFCSHRGKKYLQRSQIRLYCLIMLGVWIVNVYFILQFTLETSSVGQLPNLIFLFHWDNLLWFWLRLLSDSDGYLSYF